MKGKRLRSMLTILSCQLAIPKEIRKIGNERMHKIFLTLQKYSKYKLSRCRLLGGVGKKTSISLKFDYDCVIYVNTVDPPFKELLDEWNDIFIRYLENFSGATKVTNYSIQLEVDGFKFDILPAPNYNGSIYKTKSQADVIWEKISKEQMDSKKEKLAYLYSSGLSELALKFMKKQSGFIHDLCRLAKFWNCTIVFNQYVSGRSSIIEYLAVRAGQEEEATTNRKRSILRAFCRFLSYLTEYEQINIIFTDFYDETLITKCEKPCLIDPSNPYNNFLDSVPHDFLPTLAEYSQETLNRLKKCEKNGLIEYEKLFDPQPDLRNSFKNNINITSINTMIRHCQNCNEKKPKLIERCEIFDRTVLARMKELLTYALKYYSSIFKTSSEEEIGEKIMKATEKFVNRSLYGEEDQPKSFTKNHEECDITFIFPLHTKKQDAIYISMIQQSTSRS